MASTNFEQTFPLASLNKEKEVWKTLTIFEEAARKKGFQCIAGVDEAGRGPLAGPVVAAACCLPNQRIFSGINDSKKLSEKERERLFQELTSHPDVFYGIGVVSESEIDTLNIYQATMVAMKKAVKLLPHFPDYLLVDGLQLPTDDLRGIYAEKLIKGDSRSLSIAAASILAKVTRDKIMLELHDQRPEYGFAGHKGYGTKKHREAIERYGPCPAHRVSFNPIKSMLAQKSFI